MSAKIDEGRRSRIEKYKKIIMGLIIILLVIPIIISVYLAIRLHQVNSQLDRLETQMEEIVKKSDRAERSGDKTLPKEKDLTDAAVSGKSDTESLEAKISETAGSKGNADADNAPEGVKGIQDQSKGPSNSDRTDKIKVYLTFDDGPSSNTDKILDILSEYGVKATFFVTGKEGEQYERLYQRIVDEGHTLGMHSYTHKYDEIYASKEAFIRDLEKLQDYLYVTTGTWSRFYRFPGGSSNQVSAVPMEELTAYLDSQNIYYLDWNIVSGDASGYLQSAGALSDRVLRNIGKEETQVVLFHDAAEKSTTVEALSIVLDDLTKRDDVEVLPVSDDMDLESVQHIGSDA